MGNRYYVYALLAADGVFLHHSYQRVVYCRDKYFHGSRLIHGFQSVREAEIVALEHLKKITPQGRIIPKYLTVDKFYHWKKFDIIE